MKKILVLAFVSAAFLFGCSADGYLSSTATPPAWKGGPSSAPGGGPNPPSNNESWCIIYDYYYDECDCYSMAGHTAEECYYEGGDEISNTCPSQCYKHNSN
ncbi:MAG: hypothetical protein LBC87_09265 [Fibromonadaceae bacterium]|jgi:hypothetical protein|nr:hypothetical protein [Fibromonadaceae bacterium]